MIVSRRKSADRTSRVVLSCLVAGLGGAAWLALSPPAPVEPYRAPAASQPVPAAGPVVPAGDDLAILWPGAHAAAAASHRLSSSSPAAEVPVSGSETPPFTIRGVIASSSGSSSVAFVQSSSGAVVMVPQGEVVDGWKLIRVMGITATFAREGRVVALRMPKPEYAAGGRPEPSNVPPQAMRAQRRFTATAYAPPPSQSPAQRPPDSDTGTTASRSAAPSAAGDADGKTVVVPRSVADMALSNPGAAMQGLQLAPLMSKGQMQGVTIANVAQGSLAAPYFAPGDQILAVNGAPINSVAGALNIYQQLISSGSTSVTLTMQRGGQRQNVVYTVQ